MGGFGCDVLLVNTRGMANEFNLWGGEICSAFDVPFFDRPCAVHFTHSFSLQVPTDPGTIGGAFIENGAYAYFGSVHEP